MGYRPNPYPTETRSPDVRLGRWPANLIVKHKAGCRREGTRQVRSDGHYPSQRPAGSEIAGASGHRGQERLEERHTSGEHVDVWVCEEGCPVPSLGPVTKSCRSTVVHDGYSKSDSQQVTFLPSGGQSPPSNQYDDEGPVVRFFKQVQ
jgi:hypothetical protein